jgi:hypothetical protein
MKKAIKRYKGLSKKELTLAYNKVRSTLTRAAHRASIEAEKQLDNSELPTPAAVKRLEKLDREMDELQSELDAIGLLKAGRF